MSNLLTVGIQLDNIWKIEIYLNPKRKSLATIKKETGADYILNGTLYNMTTCAVNCHLKANGKVIAAPNYRVQGYSWDEGQDISLDLLPSPLRKNYIACTPLVSGGVAIASLTYDKGQGGKRGRTAIGLKDSRLMLYVSRDGSTSARTPEQLRDDLKAAGWSSAIMLDGGGSSQCDFKGEKISSSRNVQHLILVYCKDNEPKGDEPSMHGIDVKAYSKTKDGATKLSKNFAVSEFACSDGSDTIFIAPALVDVLQKVRDYFKRPVSIVSGYRTESKNKSVGGVQYSQHKYGTAADIVVSGYTPKAVAAYLEKIMPNTGGIGIYSTFTHVDVRKEKARWNG